MPLSAIGGFLNNSRRRYGGLLEGSWGNYKWGFTGSFKVLYKVWGVGFRVHISGVISPLNMAYAKYSYLTYATTHEPPIIATVLRSLGACSCVLALPPLLLLLISG